MQVEGPVQVGQLLRKIAESSPYPGTAGESPCVVRLEVQRLVQVCERRVAVAVALVRGATGRPGESARRVASDPLAQIADRLLTMAQQAMEFTAQDDVPGVVRLQFQCPIEDGERALVVARRAQGDRLRAVGPYQVGVEGQSLVVVLQRTGVRAVPRESLAAQQPCLCPPRLVAPGMSEQQP
ncbi:hypothetical protein BIV24_12740 [Streptomyces colonosanans]|uniref:Uncharacterized protein n=1 Tax=Streptomyces colonosanans TaxID=1428652 RepID=A0A1S2PGR9_9ACTN|nr:hypothetical protein BIV24_12740 [Streptomyces colonosanans]